MINFRKWTATKPTNKLIWFICCGLLVFSACSESEKPDKYVARVNNSFLTESELENRLAEDRYSKKHREEFIRDWIESEVLFQEAESERVLEDTLYKRIIHDSEKELASAILIKKFFDENLIRIGEDEIRRYYEDHKQEFRFSTDVYVYNLIRFTDELRAIDFRNTLIETDWNKASSAFSEDSSIRFKSAGIMKRDYELNPPVMAKILKYLNGNEVSIIFETEPEIFNIVQLVEKIDKNTVPELIFIRKIVKARLSVLKKHEIYKQYLDDLFSKYNVVINRY